MSALDFIQQWRLTDFVQDVDPEKVQVMTWRDPNGRRDRIYVQHPGISDISVTARLIVVASGRLSATAESYWHHEIRSELLAIKAWGAKAGLAAGTLVKIAPGAFSADYRRFKASARGQMRGNAYQNCPYCPVSVIAGPAAAVWLRPADLEPIEF